MKFTEYLLDKKYFLVFYLLLMSFISLIVLLDPNKGVSYSNLLYINSVSLLLVTIYLMTDYLCYRKYYQGLRDLIKNRDRDIVCYLPEALTYQQKLCNEIIKEIYYNQRKVIKGLNNERREHQEYVNTWFHEIKTPITVSRLLLENSQEKSKESILESLEEELNRIEQRVEQALYYARSDSFAKDYFIQELNLSKVVRGIVKKYARVFISSRIKVELNELELMVNSDQKWLAFVIDQIIANSLKYISQDGTISIWGETGANEKRIIIKDNGPGIKTEDLPRIFERGFTGYRGRIEQKSTGMGLYLARKLARKLGHDITAESRFGEYTIMIIHFPLLADYYQL